ncbi:RlmE family RNA methyltransferase [bacterium]|nr:RlmE family RNA methyltransferase [bacterium]
MKTLSAAHVVAVDLSPLEIPEDPRLTFLHGSIEDVDIVGALGGRKADLVLSDMAPKTSGQAFRDVALSLTLCELAFENAKMHLKPGGGFVVKVFMGEGFETYREMVRKAFTKHSLFRPLSTRKHSREIFITGQGFKG